MEMNKIMSIYNQLNLHGYFNLKYINLNEDEHKKASETLDSYGLLGSFFNYTSKSGWSENIEFDGIPFTLPKISYNKYDSISCEGQTINILENNYAALHILGTRFWGPSHNIDKLSIFCNNGNHYETDIFIRDFYSGNTKLDLDKYDCSIIIKGREPSSNQNRYIYYTKSHLPVPDQKIQRIQLPYNPELLIFSITLEQTI